ncbi:NADH:ubiquinone oxidoreductase 17.2 kD subunit [hydrothermal vent metagenome]|uniref:NADH:ubiquinone oxidoreductase 17.2 kD subunit n=1 Tax=hydrothermal vent metagenome TaxID=652676 RepID=A0A3B0RDK3_9ZZZZ
MWNFIKQMFIWWDGQTMGTRFFTWRKGHSVGKDEAGNEYFQTKDGKRRWMIFNGQTEGSAVPPGWHGWMHHRVDTPPSEQPYTARVWEAAHTPNQTGTAQAYRPPGSILSTNPKPVAKQGYEAWKPE